MGDTGITMTTPLTDDEQLEAILKAQEAYYMAAHWGYEPSKMLSTDEAKAKLSALLAARERKLLEELKAKKETIAHADFNDDFATDYVVVPISVIDKALAHLQTEGEQIEGKDQKKA